MGSLLLEERECVQSTISHSRKKVNGLRVRMTVILNRNQIIGISL